MIREILASGLCDCVVPQQQPTKLNNPFLKSSF